MVNVAYDYQIFCRQKYGGISRYIYEVARRLFDYDDLNVRILAGAYVNEYLKQAQPDLVLGYPVPKISKFGKVLEFFNQAFVTALLSSNPPSVIHETFYSSNTTIPKRSKVVLTVYDLISEKFYPDDPVVAMKADAIKRADHLICISQSTKQDLMELFDIDQRKISVICLGCSLIPPVGDDRLASKIEEPYILYVGDRYGYKNFQNLLRAYATSSRLMNDFKLICFGGLPFTKGEAEFWSTLGIPEDRLIRVSGNDAMLATFYQNAAVFVYPSTYEGFGIPLLEAMTTRCPIACSNTSSLPEVVGDAAELFDPHNIDSISDALEKVLYSTEKRNYLIARGIERRDQFSWDKCAEETRTVYLSLV